MNQVEVAIPCATSHKEFANQIHGLISAGFQPCGSPYVPPFWTPIDDQPRQDGQLQIAQVYVRVRETLVAPLDPALRPKGYG